MSRRPTMHALARATPILIMVAACGDGSLWLGDDVWLIRDDVAEPPSDVQAPDVMPEPDAIADGAADDLAPHPDSDAGSDVASPIAIGWCRLEGPTDLQLLPGASATVGGRVHVPGLTDRTPAVDLHPDLVARLVWGAGGTLPDTWSGAADARPDSDWDGAAAGTATHDAWLADLPPDLPVGTHDYAFAFSADGGLTFTFCDRNAGLERDGAEDGYSPDNAGKLLVYTDPCAPNPCETRAPVCDGDTLVTFAAPGTCTNPAFTEAVCTFGEASRTPCGETDRRCIAGACREGRPPAAGELVFSELMLRPLAVAPEIGQWLELRNISNDVLQLAGLSFLTATDGVTFTEDVVVAPGGYVVLGRSRDANNNGGVGVDIVLPAEVAIDPAGDVLSVVSGETVLARVDLAALGAAPLVPGASVQLASESPDPALATNWCNATAAYGAGDLGTPGAPNTRCRYAIDRCRLHGPRALTVAPTTPFTPEGRFLASGLTDRTPRANDADPLVRAAFAVFRLDDPGAPESWTWVVATPDPGWAGDAGDGADDAFDVYSRQLAAPATPGAYGVAFRVSGDAGATWTLCDRDLGPGEDGSEDGFSVDAAGGLTVTNPCLPNPCIVAPAARCDGTSVLTPAATGICLGEGAGYVCDHDTNGVRTSCPAYCAEGRCEDWRFAERPGDLVITEYQPDSSLGTPGTWLELHNPTADPMNARGLTLSGPALAPLEVDVALIVPPGGYLVVAASGAPDDNGGVEADLVWPELLLGQTSAILRVVRGGTIIDEVAWSAAWPRGIDVSTALGPAALGAGDAHLQNDSAASWCLATEPYNDTAFGSPGAENPSCAAGVTVIRTSPADGSSDVEDTTPVIVNFSVPMNTTTLTAQTVRGECAGTFQLSYDDFTTCVPFEGGLARVATGGSSVTLIPAPALTRGLTYRLRITTDAQSVNGVPLAEDFEASFVVRRPFACGGAPIVAISQVYGAGGNAGAAYRRDFVELHNRTRGPVTLDGWSLRYASANGTSWNNVTYLSGVVPPGGFFLVEQAGGTNGAELPTPDQTSAINLSGTSGKLALLRDASTSWSGGNCPDSTLVIDFVGFGASNCAEGSLSTGAPAASATTSIWRDVHGCVDHNVNATDFFAGPADPRNSAAAPVHCSCNEEPLVNDLSEGDPREAYACQIVEEATFTVLAGDERTLEGQLFQPGLTDLHTGEAPGVLVEVGFGRASVAPASQVDWGWVAAPFAGENSFTGFDMHAGTIVAPARTASTSYRAAMRVSLDDGESWTLCDLDGAGAKSTFAFDVEQLPMMTIVPP